jgi:hypothetical protein
MRTYAEARQLGDSQVRSVKYRVEYNRASRQQRALYAEMYAGSTASGHRFPLAAATALLPSPAPGPKLPQEE